MPAWMAGGILSDSDNSEVFGKKAPTLVNKEVIFLFGPTAKTQYPYNREFDIVQSFQGSGTMIEVFVLAFFYRFT
jgi:hypothetical protein